VYENPTGNRRGSNVQSVLERKREKGRKRRRRETAGSDRPKEGDGGTQDGKACEKDSFPVCFSRPWNGELDEERKGRESRKRWRR